MAAPFRPPHGTGHWHRVRVETSSHLVDPEWADGPCADLDCELVELRELVLEAYRVFSPHIAVLEPRGLSPEWFVRTDRILRSARIEVP